MKKSLKSLMFVGAVLGMLQSNNANAFGEENVLNVSPRDYVESEGKKLSDYKMGGIHSTRGYGSGISCAKSLALKVRENYHNAEVIVKFKDFYDDYRTCSGTVLIPREKTQ